MPRTANPNAEKLTKQVVFVLQPSLYSEFEKQCKSQYKSVSEMLRELIMVYVKEQK